MRSSISIKQEAFGRNRLFLAPAEFHLADLLRHQGKLEEPEKLYKSAATKVEKAHGPNAPSVATILEELSILYMMKSKYVDAETVLERGLIIRESQYGSDHPITARDQADLALEG